MLDRVKALEEDNKRLRDQPRADAMEGVDAEDVGADNLGDLQEPYDVCQRVQPNAAHTAEIKAKLDKARQAKANAKPLHAQTANAEKKLLRRRRAAEAARIKVHGLAATLQEARAHSEALDKDVESLEAELAALHERAIAETANKGAVACPAAKLRSWLPPGATQVPGMEANMASIENELK